MLTDPFAPPPAPRPMRLSELVETDLLLGERTSYASTLPPSDASAVPLYAGHPMRQHADDAYPFGVHATVIGPPFDPRGVVAFDVCFN